ncbi:hypothetical protein V8C40DRAFT_255754 [Trichoderma camerunense]
MGNLSLALQEPIRLAEAELAPLRRHQETRRPSRLLAPMEWLDIFGRSLWGCLEAQRRLNPHSHIHWQIPHQSHPFG